MYFIRSRSAEKFGLFFANIYTNNQHFNNMLSSKVVLTLAHVKVKVADHVWVTKIYSSWLGYQLLPITKTGWL